MYRPAVRSIPPDSTVSSKWTLSDFRIAARGGRTACGQQWSGIHVGVPRARIACTKGRRLRADSTSGCANPGNPVFTSISHIARLSRSASVSRDYGHCLQHGIEITEDRIPVVPAAHYSCGGIAVDEWGRSSLPGLRAVGEVACTSLKTLKHLAEPLRLAAPNPIQ
jgi:hypothetical protein